MKKYLKENIKNLPFILIAFIMFYGITTLATNYLFNSNEVSYDNTETGLHADEVQGAIDEVFQHATDYTNINTRLTSAENTIGSGSLTTTSQNLIGGINEVNGKITNISDGLSIYTVNSSGGGYKGLLSQLQSNNASIPNKKLVIFRSRVSNGQDMCALVFKTNNNYGYAYGLNFYDQGAIYNLSDGTWS